MDCFAALAMTAEYTSAISPRVFRARFDIQVASSNQRAQGMPDAQCTRSLVGKNGQQALTSSSHHE
jgi:hypothetical protein